MEAFGGRKADSDDIEIKGAAKTDKGYNLHQLWDIWYFDAMPPVLKKGDLNPSFGLYIDRPFFV